MNLGIWLVPVLLGFAILNFTHIHRRAFTATTGYQFFFLAALAGAVLFVAAHSVVLAADALGNVLHPQGWTGAKALWKYVAPFAHSGKLAAAALLGLGYVVAANMMVRDEDAAARWVKRTEGAAESLLRRSLEDRTLVEVAMKTGRSYVGLVVSGDTPDVNWSGDVSLLQVFSGYRDSETRRLRLTNNYAKLGSLLDREVVVMRSEIASIRPFGLDFYLAVEAGEAELSASGEEHPL